MSFARIDGRAINELRPTKITPHFIPHAEGSALIEVGETKIICTATIEERVPPFMRNQGKGWVTAEYAMLPRATNTRNQRESSRGVSGRTQEIQRLVGRSLRSVIDPSLLGERTITVDCDVIQADGGTRTASITGGFVALQLACRYLQRSNVLRKSPIIQEIAAVSVGIVENTALLDLDYSEDSNAEVDMNIVCNASGKFIEIQGTAEKQSFSREQMNDMLTLAEGGIKQLMMFQRYAANA